MVVEGSAADWWILGLGGIVMEDRGEWESGRVNGRGEGGKGDK